MTTPTTPEQPEPSALTPTPRTEAAIANGYRFSTESGEKAYVPADFARSLERELAPSSDAITHLRACVEDYSRNFFRRNIWDDALDFLLTYPAPNQANATSSQPAPQTTTTELASTRAASAELEKALAEQESIVDAAIARTSTDNPYAEGHYIGMRKAYRNVRAMMADVALSRATTQAGGAK